MATGSFPSHGFAPTQAPPALRRRRVLRAAALAALTAPYAWDDILLFQLDSRHRPCNLVELMPRLLEHLKVA